MHSGGENTHPNEESGREKETARAATGEHLRRRGQGDPEQLAGFPTWISWISTTAATSRKSTMEHGSKRQRQGTGQRQGQYIINIMYVGPTSNVNRWDALEPAKAGKRNSCRRTGTSNELGRQRRWHKLRSVVKSKNLEVLGVQDHHYKQEEEEDIQTVI